MPKVTSHFFPGPAVDLKPEVKMAKSKLESRFELLWRAANGPELKREMRFHPVRKWRADFAHEPTRTLIEVEGGIFMGAGGRHNRGMGYANDAEKYLEAALHGWTVLRLTEKQLTGDWIRRIIARITGPAGFIEGADFSSLADDAKVPIRARDGEVVGYAVRSVKLGKLGDMVPTP